MKKKQRREQVIDYAAIVPEMTVQSADIPANEKDISEPVVQEVVEDESGNVEKLVVSKGIVFKKTVEVPADQIQAVRSADPSSNEHGEVILSSALDDPQSDTAAEQQPSESAQKKALSDGKTAEESSLQKHGLASVLHTIGPGFISGITGNDASAVAVYSIDGAQNGYGHLWLLLLSTPLIQVVFYACAKVGRVTKQGFAEILKDHYGWVASTSASLLLLIANIALISANLVAIASGLELLTHISWIWFIIPVGVLLWYCILFQDFETIKKVFLVFSCIFIVYFITAFFAHADWQQVAINTFVPHLNLDFTSISTAVALLGATISPYTMYWQARGEKEEKRTVTRTQQFREIAIDIASGVISGNSVAYFIIISTSATLFLHHKHITAVVDAAVALQPILGPFAVILFALGFIGAGLLAIPVLLASTSYTVAGTFGWPSSLSKKPWQNEGFYLIITLAICVSTGIAFLHVDPVSLIFWANVLNGVLAPILIVYLLCIGNNHSIMKKDVFPSWINGVLVVAVLIMTTAIVLLFYGLFTGQGG